MNNQHIVKENECMLVTDKVNKKYLTGFRGSTCEVIVFHNKMVIITDGRYKTQVKEEVYPGIEIIITDSNVSYEQAIINVIKDSKLTKLKIEAEVMTLSNYQALKNQLTEMEFILTENLISELRESKDENELALLKKACQITDQAFIKVVGNLEEGVTELEVKFQLEQAMMMAGIERPSFDSIVVFGKNTAKPHGQPGTKKLEIGDMVTIDFGGYYHGYTSDMTRTFFFKEIGDETLSEIWDIVHEAQQRQIKAVKAGVTAGVIDKIGRDYITEKGYGEYFLHTTGHGLGTDVHESPRIKQGSTKVLEENLCFTIEPGIYLEGRGGCRLENDLVVTKDGSIILNETPINKVEHGSS